MMKNIRFTKTIILGFLLAIALSPQVWADGDKLKIKQYGDVKTQVTYYSSCPSTHAGGQEECPEELNQTTRHVSAYQTINNFEFELIGGNVVFSKSTDYESINLDSYTNDSDSPVAKVSLEYTKKVGATAEIEGEKNMLLDILARKMLGVKSYGLKNSKNKLAIPGPIQPGESVIGGTGYKPTTTETDYYELTPDGLKKIDDIVAYRNAKAAKSTMRRTSYTPAEAAAHVNHTNNNKITFTFK